MGAVANTYLAQLLPAPDIQVALKIVRPDVLGDPENVDALRKESRTLDELNAAEDTRWRHISEVVDRARYAERTKDQRYIVALLGQGEVEPGQPFVVQEVAPPAFKRFEIQSPADELKLLRVMKAVVDVMTLTHHTGMALKDFEPETKGDRIRVQWDESQRGFLFKMIDWNVTGNTKQEQAQDLLYFGGHLYYFLLGRHLRFDNPERSDQSPQPPVNISMGVPNWEEITEGSRQLLQKLLHRDPQRRYQSAEALSQDMTWWIDTLEQIGASDALRRLDKRLWQARPAGQYDRVLAIADLGLRLNPPTDARESFLESLQKAREEMEKADWEPIARARVTLGTGAYEGAAREFAQQVRVLDPESKTARIARIYLQLSRAGFLLKKKMNKRDIRSTPEWELIERAAGALVDEQWRDAQEAVSDLTRRLPTASSWAPVKTLRDLAQAGVLAEEAVRLAQEARPRRPDADRPEWFQIEREQIQKQGKAVEALKQARDLASDEPAIKNALLNETQLLEQRKHFLQRYRDADKFIDTAEKTLEEAKETYNSEDYAGAATLFEQARQAYQDALQEFQWILSQDAKQPRASIYRDRIQQREYDAEQRWREATERAETQNRFEDAVTDAQEALRLGQYDGALHHARVAAEIAPDRVDIQAMVAESRTGERLLVQARREIQSAETYAQMGNFEQANDLLKEVLSRHGRPLSELSEDQSFSGGVGRSPFRLLEDVATQANDLLKWTKAGQEADQAADRAWKRGDYESVVATYKQYEFQLTPAQDERLSQAKDRIKALKKAESLTEEAESPAKSSEKTLQVFEDLRSAWGLIADDPSRKADNIRKRIFEGWRRCVESLSDWRLASERLREGLQLFEGGSIETFEEMLDLVEIAHGLQPRLAVHEVASWPDWLSRQGWQGDLLRVVDRLSRLEGPQSWRALREQVDAWYDKLIKEDQSYLAAWLRERYESACEKSRENEFEEALKDAEACWTQLPVEVQDDLPADVQKVFQTLLVDLRARLDAETRLRRILQQVDDGGAFSDAYTEASKLELPDTENVSSEDLQATVTDLQRAAEMERLHGSSPTDDTYAQIIYDCRRLKDAKLKALTGVTGLAQRLAKLQEKLGDKSDEIAVNLLKELRDETESQKAHPRRDPKRLLLLYRQARWLEAISLRELSKVTAVQTAVKDILQTITNDLQQAETSVAFDSITKQLAQLIRLNNGVTHTDESPPLPEGVAYESVQRPLGNELEALRDEVQEMSKLAPRAAQLKPDRLEKTTTVDNDESPQLPVSEEEADTTSSQMTKSTKQETVSYNAEQVGEIRELSQAVRTTLQDLKRTWKAFEDLSGWEPESSLGRIGAQAELLQYIAETLGEAQQRMAQKAAMQGLDVLYRRLEQDNRLDALGEAQDKFWEMPRQAVQVNYRAMRKALIAALSQQVSDILDSPDAVERLQRQILYVPRQKSVAQAAYEAIYDGVRQRAAMVEADLQRREARRLWEIVMKATVLWGDDNSESTESSSLWDRLKMLFRPSDNSNQNYESSLPRREDVRRAGKPSRRETPASWEKGQ
jgi:hypothetical protein